MSTLSGSQTADFDDVITVGSGAAPAASSGPRAALPVAGSPTNTAKSATSSVLVTVGTDNDSITDAASSFTSAAAAPHQTRQQRPAAAERREEPQPLSDGGIVVLRRNGPNTYVVEAFPHLQAAAQKQQQQQAQQLQSPAPTSTTASLSSAATPSAFDGSKNNDDDDDGQQQQTKQQQPKQPQHRTIMMRLVVQPSGYRTDGGRLLLDYTKAAPRHPNAIMPLHATKHWNRLVVCDLELADFGPLWLWLSRSLVTRRRLPFPVAPATATTPPEATPTTPEQKRSERDKAALAARIATAKSVLFQMLSACCYFEHVHDGMTHGNAGSLKSSVLLSHTGCVKLTPFGVIDEAAIRANPARFVGNAVLLGCAPECRISVDRFIEKLRDPKAQSSWPCGAAALAIVHGVCKGGNDSNNDQHQQPQHPQEFVALSEEEQYAVEVVKKIDELAKYSSDDDDEQGQMQLPQTQQRTPFAQDVAKWTAAVPDAELRLLLRLLLQKNPERRIDPLSALVLMMCIGGVHNTNAAATPDAAPAATSASTPQSTTPAHVWSTDASGLEQNDLLDSFVTQGPLIEKALLSLATNATTTATTPFKNVTTIQDAADLPELPVLQFASASSTLRTTDPLYPHHSVFELHGALLKEYRNWAHARKEGADEFLVVAEDANRRRPRPPADAAAARNNQRHVDDDDDFDHVEMHDVTNGGDDRDHDGGWTLISKCCKRDKQPEQQQKPPNNIATTTNGNSNPNKKASRPRNFAHFIDAGMREVIKKRQAPTYSALQVYLKQHCDEQKKKKNKAP